MKIIRLIILFVSLYSSYAISADVGLGVSAKTSDAIIYLPIDVSGSFRVEPALRYFHSEQSDEYTSYDTEHLELSLGLFGTSKIDEKIGIYYGARLGYIKQKTDIEYNWGTQSSESDGYIIAPTIGIEYYLTDKFSLGAEAEWYYQDIDGEDGYDGDMSDYNSKSSGTGSRLILRYMF